MAMPQCCYLAKGAKRPSHTTNTIKFDGIPFDPCNSIKRFDLCPFDQKNSTCLQPPDTQGLLAGSLHKIWLLNHRKKRKLGWLYAECEYLLTSGCISKVFSSIYMYLYTYIYKLLTAPFMRACLAPNKQSRVEIILQLSVIECCS